MLFDATSVCRAAFCRSLGPGAGEALPPAALYAVLVNSGMAAASAGAGAIALRAGTLCLCAGGLQLTPAENCRALCIGFAGTAARQAAAGLAAGSASQYILSQSYPGCLICSCGVLLGLEALRLFRGVVTDTAAFGAMLPVAGAELALSLAWSPVIYLLFRSIYRRVGGTRLA